MTISDYEKSHNIIALDRSKYPADKKIDDSFSETVAGNIGDFLGMNHKDRIEFLKKNGYELTHENMVNSDLSTIQSE